MELGGVWAVLAAALGLGAGFFLGDASYGAVQRRKHAASALMPDEKSWVSARLSSGCALLMPMARRLCRIRAVDASTVGLVRVLGQRGIASAKDALLSWELAAFLLLSCALGLLSGSAVGGLAAGCCAALGLASWAKTQEERRCTTLREQVPEALRCMGVCFRSGLSLQQTFGQVARESNGALGERFAAAGRRLEMGSSTSEALEVLRADVGVPELAFVAVALDVQHQSGGSVTPVLDAARESVEGELELLRSLRVQTAQAKLSARIVTIMPFLLVALFSLMSPGFLTPFFSSVMGWGLLALALAMQLSGVLIVRRLLRVEAG